MSFNLAIASRVLSESQSNIGAKAILIGPVGLQNGLPTAWVPREGAVYLELGPPDPLIIDLFPRSPGGTVVVSGVGGVIEKIKYSGRTGNKLTGLERGVLGTTPTELPLNSEVVLIGQELTDDALGALGGAFGVPDCMLEIAGGAAAALLPTTFLGAIALGIKEGMEAARNLIKWIKTKVLDFLGYIEDELGNKINSIFGFGGVFDELGNLATLLGAAAGFATEITENLQQLEGEIGAIQECLVQLGIYQKLRQSSGSVQFTKDPSYVDRLFAGEMAQLKFAADFLKRAQSAIDNINRIVYERTLNPDLEPIYIDADLAPYGAAKPKDQDKEIFRLVYGPPKSKKGQFILSVDGLYYDSQSGGIPTPSGVIAKKDKYKFEYPSNLGGKGDMVSLEKINKYVDTIFDLNTIDNSPALQVHYDADHMLQVLQGQRDKHIYDTSSTIRKLLESGDPEYAADSALIINMQQSLYSIHAQHESKINRRKKQIEVAIKAPYLLGKNPAFVPGKVPINDFSHLADLNLPVAYEKQTKLTFKQGEVSGVVLPYKPKFVKIKQAANIPQMTHLIVPDVGTGGIIYDSDTSGTQGTILSLTDSVTTNGLFAIYNFLRGNVTSPGSDEYSVLNCASSGNNIDNAKLVGFTPSSIFRHGLAIPYLTGMTKLTTLGTASSPGAYIQLPSTARFRDLTYKTTGFTIDFWARVPSLTTVDSATDPDSGYGVSSYHRLILACENTGGPDMGLDDYRAPYDRSSDVVQGMVMGFTRDRQVTQNLIPSNNSADNSVTAGMFYIAPTRSVNGSSVGFINKQSLIGCAENNSYEVCKVGLPLSSLVGNTGKTVGSVSGEFMHFAVAVDPTKDSIKIYIDGNQLVSRTLSESFGVRKGESLRVPSFAKNNSFQYNASNVTGAVSYFKDGPRVGEGNFTPWIIGGGFTDGYKTPPGENNLGFMGNGHGIKSGLNGYVGSMKFYSRPLTSVEIVSNFKSQKGFFKNIDLT